MRRESLWLPVLSILTALVLTVVPLPDWMLSLRPYWVALVLIYWILEGPFDVSLGFAFLLGLALDLVVASLLGQHALGLVIITYLVRQFRSRIRFFPPWQQAAAVLALLVNDRIIELWILLLVGERHFTWSYWLSPLVSAFLWPWIFLFIDRLRGARRRHHS